MWEQANGPIPPGGIIHHINENKVDNQIENLKLVESVAAHATEHGGALRDFYPPARLTHCHPERPHRALGLCQPCYSKQYAERNSEWIEQEGRKYRERNRERKREYDRKYRERNKAG